MKKILILFAMEAEARPILSQGFKPVNDLIDNKYPIKLFSKIEKSIEIFVALNGRSAEFDVDLVATQPATLTCDICCRLIQPDLIINAGTAGAWLKNKSSIGEILIASQTAFFDRRINLPKYSEYGVMKIDAPSFATDIAKELNLSQGLVATGNSLDTSDVDRIEMEKLNPIVKDMEAATIAWVASIHKIPLIVVKAITDHVDGEISTEKEFVANFTMATNNLKSALLKILSILNQRKTW